MILAAFGNFTFNAPTTSAPPAFGAPTAAPQQNTGFGAPSAFGQNTFGATGKRNLIFLSFFLLAKVRISTIVRLNFMTTGFGAPATSAPAPAFGGFNAATTAATGLGGATFGGFGATAPTSTGNYPSCCSVLILCISMLQNVLHIISL